MMMVNKKVVQHALHTCNAASTQQEGNTVKQTNNNKNNSTKMRYHRNALLALHFKQKGLELIGKSHHSHSLKVRDRRFKAAFGTSSMVIAIIWQATKEKVAQNHPSVCDVHVLWAFHFMKCYSTEVAHVAALRAGDEKTFQKWVWIFLQEISYLQEEVVSAKKSKKNVVAIILAISFFDGSVFLLFHI